MNKHIEIFGWYGAVAIIVAYGLVSFSVLLPTSMWYQLLNLTGALGIATVSLSKRTYQPAVLNGIWVLIALVAVFRIIFE